VDNTIVLVNPNSNVEVMKRLDITTPPLGLGYLASVLRKEGFKVKIIDDAVEKFGLNKFLNKVKNAFIIGITSTTPTFNAALKYAQKIKSRFPEVFVVLGGVHVTFMPYDALKHEFVDAVCIGEGEYTLKEIAERIERGETLEGIKGLIYKEGGKIIDNGKREPIQDLDSLPFPAYDLMPLDKYTVLGRKLEHFPIISSRGCPFGCRYCSSSLFMGRKFRARSAKNVVDEVEWLVNEFKAQYVAFSDDTFTLNRKRVEEICREIINRGIEVEWSCSSRVDTINRSLLEKMKRAGCSAIYYGVESASPAILRYYRKKINLDKVKRAVKLTKDLGIITICSFIIGSPYETKEDMKATLKFALKLDPDYAQFSILTPYPGTEIYEEAKEKGLLLSTNFDDYTAGKPVLRNLYMSKEEISRFLKYCYLRFYLRPKFILRELKRGNFKVALEVLRRSLKKES